MKSYLIENEQGDGYPHSPSVIFPETKKPSMRGFIMPGHKSSLI